MGWAVFGGIVEAPSNNRDRTGDATRALLANQDGNMGEAAKFSIPPAPVLPMRFWT